MLTSSGRHRFRLEWESQQASYKKESVKTRFPRQRGRKRGCLVSDPACKDAKSSWLLDRKFGRICVESTPESLAFVFGHGDPPKMCGMEYGSESVQTCRRLRTSGSSRMREIPDRICRYARKQAGADVPSLRDTPRSRPRDRVRKTASAHSVEQPRKGAYEAPAQKNQRTARWSA